MSQLSRRQFLKGVVALGAGAMLYKYSDGNYRIVMGAGRAPAYQLRIIHTNDHHARIEPASLTIGKTPENVNALRNFGGVSRRQTLFDQIRADATVGDKLFLDAGDVFQGTLYFNLYEGAADLDFYNRLGYHALTVGNHEFDKGDQILTNFINGAQFPVVSANISLKVGATSPLTGVKVTGDTTANGKLGDRTIVTLPSGKKIGIFGLTAPDTPLLSSPSSDVVFGQDLAAIAQEQVDLLKTAGADVIVALTHIGFLADKDLAAATHGIHVIVGGHSHTPLISDDQNTLPLGVTRVDTYPVVVTGADTKPVIIVTDWEWAKWVGDMVVGFDENGNLVEVASPGALDPNPTESTGQIRPVWADGILPAGRALLAGEEPEITPDPTVQARIDTEYKPGVDALQNEQIAVAGVFLDGERNNVRSRETNMSNIVTDALRDLILARPDFNPQHLPVVTIVNGGGIRASIQIGNVTLGALISVLPFGNTVATVVVSGENLIAALENGVSQVETGAGRFPQVAGLRFLWNSLGAAGKRIVRAETLITEPTGRTHRAFTPVDPLEHYLVVTNNFMLTGGDGYSAFTPTGGGTDQLDTGLLMLDVVQEHIQTTWPYFPATQTYVPIDQQIDGRILRINQWMPIVFNKPAFVD